MLFNENELMDKAGIMAGFVFGYFLFTTILFFLLTFLNKIPEDWTYLHIASLTLLITLIGAFLKYLLR